MKADKKATARHILKHQVSIPVQLLEALLDLLQVLVGLAQPAHNSGGSRAHHSHKLVDVDLSIIVGVTDGKDGLDLSGVEPASTRPHLLLADQTVAVLVQDLEHLLGVRQVLHVPGEARDGHASGGAHEADKLLQVDVAVLVEVSKHEDCLGLLTVELSTASNLLLAQNTVLVNVDGQESLLDIRDVLELSAQTGHNGECRGAHDRDELVQVDGSIVVDVAESEDGFNLGVVELVARGGHLLSADRAVAVLVQQLEGSLDIVDGLEGGADLEGHFHSGGEHEADELAHIDLAIAIDVSKLEDGVDLLSIKLVTLHHLLLAQQAVVVPVNLLERLFAVVEVPERFADPLHNAGRAWAHEADELLKGDLTITIDIAKAEDGVDLNI